MFKKLILFAFIGGLFYLNHTNPPREVHEELLLAEMQRFGPVSEEQFAELLKEIDYSNFMVCSATKATLDNQLITFGFRKEVALKNEGWIRQAVRKIQGS